MIPRIIHQIWVGPPLPEYMAQFNRRWSELHPDWEVVVWGDEDLDWLKNRSLYDKAEQYVPKDAVGQFRSDVARYEILNKHGGVYIDFDTEPLKPIDPLIGVGAFATWEEEGKYITNAVMGAEQGHPFMKLLIDSLPASARRYKGKPATYVSGPRLLSRLYFDFAPDLTVYPKEYFLPYLYSDISKDSRPERGSYPNSYGVHHWNHRRTLRGLEYDK